MAFSLCFSIKSKLFLNSPSFLLGVKELILRVGNPVSRGIIARFHKSLKMVSLLLTYEGWSDMSKRRVIVFHPLSLYFIQSFLESIHYDLIDSLNLSIPLWICQGGISVCYAQVTAIPPEGFAIKLKPLSKMSVLRIPNRVTIIFQINLLASISLILASSSALTHLVK